MLTEKNVRMTVMSSSYRILGCPIVKSPSIEELQQMIQSRIAQRKGFYTVAVNAEKIIFYNQNPQVKDVLDNSDLPYADGSGALLGLKMLHGISTFKINMPLAILEICNNTGLPLFMLGAGEDVIGDTVAAVKSTYRSVNLVGFSHGFIQDKQEMINRIKSSGAKVIMIAMGSPKQEILARKMLEQLSDCVFIGCGGAFNILAGKVIRAPEWIQNSHIEWLYRLIQDPRRIKRQRVLPVFFVKVLIARLRRRDEN